MPLGNLDPDEWRNSLEDAGWRGQKRHVAQEGVVVVMDVARHHSFHLCVPRDKRLDVPRTAVGDRLRALDWRVVQADDGRRARVCVELPAATNSG